MGNTQPLLQLAQWKSVKSIMIVMKSKKWKKLYSIMSWLLPFTSILLLTLSFPISECNCINLISDCGLKWMIQYKEKVTESF